MPSLRFRWWNPWRRLGSAPSSRESPLRAELFSADQMEQHGRALAQGHRLSPRRAKDRLLARLADNEAVLIDAGNLLKSALEANQRIAPAGEWLLDNFYLIEEQVRTAQRHLPKAYSRELPRLLKGPSAGLPRAYDIALEAISHGDGRVDPESLRRFVAAYQTVTALEIGELWAIPIMLRLALIENLRRVAARIAAGTTERNRADGWADQMMQVSERDPKSLILVTADMARSNPPMVSSFVAELARRLQGQSRALALPLTWIEQRLSESGLTIEQLVQSETQEQAADQVSMSNSIGSLRLLGATDWREFVETMGVLERELRGDAVYGEMDFSTRDRYRHVVEKLARASHQPEGVVAQEAIRLAREASPGPAPDGGTPERASHVGYYLIDRGAAQLERALRLRHSLASRLGRIGRRFGLPLYLGAIALGTGLLTAGLMALAWNEAAPGWLLALLAIAASFASSQLAIALVDRAVCAFAAPHLLPRMDFSLGITPQYRTLVVVPAMLSGADEIESLAEALEVRFLANRDDNLHFALLTDHPDAESETLPEDAALALLARTKVEELNAKYPGERFHLFHRSRRWNARERCWMGYERKRGKLAALNALLRGGPKELFALVAGDTACLAGVRYVITLDADTQLPRGTARQLVAAMAHPLNRARFDERRQCVVEGYGILQPRMAVSLPGTSQSRYARLCGSEPGIDPYTRAVSDVYQDLFAEGSFIGKGIYDVDAFERALEGRFPENQILSHDLLEGCYARSGLLSDVQLYEEYPSRYGADAARRQRWIRGDWQIAPWLFSRVPGSDGRGNANPLSLLSQWKIFDNLRRSIVPAALVVLLVAGWTLLSPARLWTVAVLAILLVPPLLAAILELLDKPREAPLARHVAASMRSATHHFALTAWRIACIPHEASYGLQAIARATGRMLLTRRRLLEWTASRELARQGAQNGRDTLGYSWRVMAAGPAAAGATAIAVVSFTPSAMLAAAPILALWFASPAIAWWLGQPRTSRASRLTADQAGFLRIAARRTWAFFERFVGPEDHWLPPDNFQEHPVAVLAHRTSPTNMGLALLANLAAYDFGYIPAGRLIERTALALATMQGLERYHGHFYNWYDTRSLKPLAPHYVSSVDSGNLASHLLTLRPGLLALCDERILGPRWLEGFSDTGMLLDDAKSAQLLSGAVLSPPASLPEARALVEALSARAIQIGAGTEGEGAKVHWVPALARQCRDTLDELAFLFPGAWHEGAPASGIPTLRELARLDGETGVRARARVAEIERLARLSGELAAMKYDFLFDPARQLLAIGYNATERRRDASFYDLLASEARATSFVAIAQGELPQESWFALGRLLTSTGGEPALLSWSGSMFEYLMPLLVMPAYGGTLLDQTCRAAVERQIAYGNKRGVPWGISESGYNAVDASLNYQYRAFGVPGLGLKRGLTDDLVVAPYASALALMVAPEAACLNLQRLAGAGLEGPLGFYEAIDYTASRVPRGQSSAVVRSYMAHHQGMVFLALASLLLDRPMQKRFASDPQFQSTMLLLQERIPKPTAFHAATAGLFDGHARSSGPQMPMRVHGGPDTAVPEVQLLSNGRYHVMVTNAGGGYSRWKDIAVTRWREDATCDNWGTFCYLRDVASGAFWSGAHHPTLERAQGYEAIFSEARAEFRRSDHDYETHMEIVVSPEDDIELRRLRITNRSRARRSIEVTTYAEVVLDAAAADALHPAFGNLFVQTEIVEQCHAILCTRRPRSASDAGPWMFHLMAVHGADAGAISYETDRAQFIGRGRTLVSPRAMDGHAPLSGSQGSVLDPIVAIRRRVALDPEQGVTIDIVSGVAESRSACLALAGKYQDRNLADRVFDLAWTHNWVTLRQINASESDAQLYGRLASAILYAHSSLRAGQAALAQNRRGQSGLWGYAISGDLPIVLLQITDGANIELVRQLVQAHAYWRLKGLAVDLVIWNEDHAGYRQVLQEQIVGLIAAGIEAHVGERPGGIFVRRAEQIADEDRILFQSVARAVITDGRGTLAEQMDRGLAEARGLYLNMPRLAPMRNAPARTAMDAARPRRDLILANPLGGFTPDGTEYVIDTVPGQPTPAPWVNVLANPRFGTVISESGSAYTWSENAHEFRLTPWSNDPVTDASGEAFYIRDEESGDFWSPTPLPCPGETPYATRHGFGYSVFEHAEDGIESTLRVYVDLEAPVKYSALRIANHSGRARRLSATGYVEWLLGDLRAKSAMHVITEIDPASGTLCARNAYNTEFAERTAFFDVDDAKRTLTCDRTEFLGRNGTLANPAALSRSQLSNKVGAALDPCAAIQVAFELADGEEREIVFRLGVSDRRGAEGAGKAAGKVRGSAIARGALEKVHAYWSRTLGAVQVRTPDPALDVLANGWLAYQTLACRLWARSGFYQSGGAFGFRDQLQDVMALVHAEPRLAREHLLRCAARQFIEGDVQHWWHPPAGRGVRTHCSDDYLWLPWATCRYVQAIADHAVLDEPVHFLVGQPVAPEADSYYDLPGQSGETSTLYTHCVRAIERGLRFGEHGLPLIGSGDWNDGMNTVGAAGKGESVWLGFFLYHVLVRFEGIARHRADDAFGERCRTQAAQLRRNIEEHGWDGDWYRRAYFDDGSILGSADNAQCRIDSIAQSWSVLSGAGDAARSRRAMQAVDERLVDREHALVRLLAPPFDGSGSNPGYIQGYVPGVRENGGQYTHAVIWAAMAFAELGDTRRAWELFDIVNPVHHANSAAALATYRVEPYVVAADVYALPPHAGRGGWTWYTGSAGWMYRLIVESLLGLRREGSRLRLAPCLPESWTGFTLSYRFGDTQYRIAVTKGIAAQVEPSLTVDGVAQGEAAIALVDDGREHAVEWTVGAARASGDESGGYAPVPRAGA